MFSPQNHVESGIIGSSHCVHEGEGKGEGGERGTEGGEGGKEGRGRRVEGGKEGKGEGRDELLSISCKIQEAMIV